MSNKHIILDLDNTLYPYEPAHKAALNATFNKMKSIFGLERSEAEEAYNNARVRNQLVLSGQAASHHRLIYFQRMFEMLGLNSLEYSVAFYETYWDTFLSNMVLSEGVSEKITEVRDNGGKVCILTDLTAHIQFRKLYQLGLSKIVDYMVSSEEVGAEKPHPYMFMRALEKIQCTAKDAIMVGDNWEKDIVGAHSQGIQSIWINENSELPQDLSEVQVVSEFKNIKL